MNWVSFMTYNEGPTKAFEAMCNQLFELWCRRNFGDKIKGFVVVNGSGGDGGIEAYTTFKDDSIIGVQSKWFPDVIGTNQINQIKGSVETAISIRPTINKYVICIPRDLSSLKRGKNGNITKDTEYSRYEKLKEEIKLKYPNLELELWTESRIIQELQKDDASGVYRYWFENSEISLEDIHYSYNKQEKGWLNQRYIPSIHCKGIIHNEILEFVGSKESRNLVYSKLIYIKTLLEEIHKKAGNFLEIVNKKHLEQRFLEEISILQIKTNNSLKILLECIKLFALEENILPLLKEIDIEVNYYLLLDTLSKRLDVEKTYFHASSLKDSIESLSKISLKEIEILIKKQISNSRLLILGDAGTGKTNGIADSVKTMLNENYHIGILIQAKSISKDNSWKDIVIKTLGISNDWSENNLWNALESLSYRKEVKNPIGINELRIVPKILICVDGIDESYPHEVWIKRLREIDAIAEKHKRIKFCITSRTYVFDKLNYKDDLRKNKIMLPSDGDSSVEELFEIYLKYYNIIITHRNWIKWSIKTPQALKLFCQCYEGKNVSEETDALVTITKLLENKIQKIDNEFIEYTKCKYSSKDYVIKKILLVLSKYFLEEPKLERESLFDLLSNNELLKFIDRNDILTVVDYLSNYGILYSYIADEGDFFSIPKTYYSLGMYSFFDYILALSVFKENNTNGLKLPKSIENNEGALQMLSILLLEDYNILIYDIKTIKSSLDEYRIVNLSYFSLINVTPRLSVKYTEFIENLLLSGREKLKECVNKVIIPVSRVDKHPLGAILLNNYLSKFETAGQRDIVWSLPDDLVQNDYYNWLELDYGDITSERYKLTKEDKYDGLPIIYAWSLTNVDNIKRSYCRKELTAWGIACNQEFYKLLNNLYQTNDPQMKEDLMAIAMSIVFSNSLELNEIKLYGEWVVKNIFSYEKIIKTYDAAIRYYGNSIVEYAYKFNAISESDMKLCRPPYKKDNSLIKLNKDALKGTRMGGYGPIHYDLSRYVLCEPISHRFFNRYSSNYVESKYDYNSHFSSNEVVEYLKEKSLSKESRNMLEQLLNKIKENEKFIFNSNDLLSYKNKEENITKVKSVDNMHNDKKYTYEKEIKDFLEVHANSVGEKSIEPEQFIISAAYNYIINIGWNSNCFEKNSDYEKCADILIMKNYRPATHGQKSTVMRFAEKYVWCARNEIYGYLADRIMFKEYKPKSYVKDYGLIDNFPNPGQELYIKNPDEEMALNRIYLPEDLSPTIEISGDGEKKIVNWIMDDKEPDFDKWINIDDRNNERFEENEICLYSFNSISEINGNAESYMWISSAIINEEDFPLLIKDMEDKREHIIRELDNPEEIKSNTRTQYHITPKEICSMEWKEDENPYIYISTIENGEFKTYEIIKAVEDCATYHNEFGDICYNFPSKYIRNITNITDNQGDFYLDENNRVVAKYYKAGNQNKDYTLLLTINKEKLYESLKVEKKVIFWIVRLLKEASSEAIERYSNLNERRDRNWIIWFEKGEVKYKLFNDIKP